MNNLLVEAAVSLIKEQAEKIRELEVNVSDFERVVEEQQEELKQKEKDTIAAILAYVEKNHDAPEIEECLWKMLDKGTEFE